MGIKSSDIPAAVLARAGIQPSAKRGNKYHAVAVQGGDGHRIDSKREAKLLAQLELRKLAGEIRLLLRQVPFHLPGGVVYRADAVAWTTAGTIEVWDAKGVKTAVYVIKKRQVEEIYGVEIKEF